MKVTVCYEFEPFNSASQRNKKRYLNTQNKWWQKCSVKKQLYKIILKPPKTFIYFDFFLITGFIFSLFTHKNKSDNKERDKYFGCLIIFYILFFYFSGCQKTHKCNVIFLTFVIIYFAYWGIKGFSKSQKNQNKNYNKLILCFQDLNFLKKKFVLLTFVSISCVNILFLNAFNI